MIGRYWLQHTNTNDFIKQIKMFTKLLLKRGYSSDEIRKNIILASEKLQLKMGNKRIFIKKPKHTQKSSTKNKIFYHFIYHPKDSTNTTIQQIYHQCFKNLPDFQNLSIHNSRPRNLQDILIPSKLRNIPLQYPSDRLQKI